MGFSPSLSLSLFFFQNFNDIKSFFDHEMKFKRENDPCSGELSYKPF